MKYTVRSIHEVFVDHVTHGQTDSVNYYTEEAEIEAASVVKAIEEYFYEVLGYEFEKRYASIDDENNVLNYSVMVDAENIEVPTASYEHKMWVAGKKVLYANDISVKVEKTLAPVYERIIL